MLACHAFLYILKKLHQNLQETVYLKYFIPRKSDDNCHISLYMYKYFEVYIHRVVGRIQLYSSKGYFAYIHCYIVVVAKISLIWFE